MTVKGKRDMATPSIPGVCQSMQEDGEPRLAGLAIMSALRQPLLSNDDSSLRHVPLLFWLAVAMSPRRSAWVGIGDGALFLGLAQALGTLGKPASLQGLDAQAGAGMGPERHEIYARHYAGFASVVPLAHPLSEVDFLVLHQPTEDMVERLKVAWLPQLSGRGVVLILGTLTQIEAVSAQIEGVSFDFSVERLGIGCRLVLCGTDLPRELAPLMNDPAAFPVAKQLFHRLGSGLVAERAAAHLPVMQANVADLMAEKADLAARLSKALSEVEDLRQAETVMTLHQAEQVTRRYELETAHRDGMARITHVEACLAQSRAAHDERVEDIACLTHHFDARAEKLRQDIAALQARAAEQLAQCEARAREQAEAELAQYKAKANTRLQRVEEELAQHKAKANTRLQRAEAELAQYKAKAMQQAKADLLKETRHQLRQERAKRDAMVNSTSWRLTRPLRGLRRLLKQR